LIPDDGDKLPKVIQNSLFIIATTLSSRRYQLNLLEPFSFNVTLIASEGPSSTITDTSCTAAIGALLSKRDSYVMFTGDGSTSMDPVILKAKVAFAATYSYLLHYFIRDSIPLN